MPFFPVVLGQISPLVHAIASRQMWIAMLENSLVLLLPVSESLWSQKTGSSDVLSGIGHLTEAVSDLDMSCIDHGDDDTMLLAGGFESGTGCSA